MVSFPTDIGVPQSTQQLLKDRITATSTTSQDVTSFAEPGAGNLHHGLWVPLKTRRLGAQLRLHTGVGVCPGVWIAKRGYVQAFVSPTAATHGCLESKPRLHMGVWSRNRGYTQVFGAPNGRLCKLPGYFSHPIFMEVAW